MRARVVLGGLAVAALAWVVAGRMHRFAYWGARHEPAAVAALARDGWQLDRFAPAAEVELLGLVRPARRNPSRHVLFLPGNSGSVLAGFSDVLQRAVGDDVALAVWAPRGFDASTGTPSPAALAADAIACWDRATRDLGWPAAGRELWGYSLGASLAVEVAARLCDRGTPPARAVLLAPGDVIPVCRAGWLGRFLPDDRYDALAAAPRVTCPVRIVHGRDDLALPIAGARRVQQALRGPVEFTELAGVGHVDLLGVLAAQRL